MDISMRRLRYASPGPLSPETTFAEMRTAIQVNALYQEGDAVLVWGNEGDLILHSGARFQELVAQHIGNAVLAEREACAKTVEALSPHCSKSYCDFDEAWEEAAKAIRARK